jgi:hypothetical protein
MIYKAVNTTSTFYSNSDGKSGKVEGIIGVGIFDEESSNTFKLLCTIDKNMGSNEDLFQEADRIAELLNRNELFITQKEAALREIRQLPI